MFDITNKDYYYMNTFGVPLLNNYDEALAHYNSVKPIRNKEVRPLGVRRHHPSASILLDSSGDVALMYINKPLVVWHKAGGFTVNAPMHYSGFTVHTLHNYLPHKMFFEWNKTRLFVKMNAEGKRYMLRRAESLKFVKTDDGYDIETPPVEHNYRKRPRVTKKIMDKRFTPFLNWVQLVTSIDNQTKEGDLDMAHDRLRAECGYRTSDWYDATIKSMKGEIATELWKDYRTLGELPMARRQRGARDWSHIQSATKVLDWISGDEPKEEWVSGLHILMRQGCEFKYDYKTRKHSLEYNFEDVTKYIEDLICVVHAKEVFIVEQLKAGEVPSRSNTVYVTEPIIHEQIETNSISSQ